MTSTLESQILSALDVTMEIEDAPVRKFMAKYPRFEPKIRDFTSVITAKTCLRKYFYQIVLGRVGKEEAVYFAWGSAYHKFRELLERNYGVGPERPKQYDSNKANDSFARAAEFALAYWRKHGKDQEVGTRWEFMTTERLLRSLITAFKHWEREKQQGRIEVIAVEQAFNVQLPDGSSTSGRADQLVRWNGKLWGRDFKTSSKDTAFFARSLEPNDQFTRYTYAEGKLAGEMIQGQLVEVMYNSNPTKKETKGPAIYEHIASRTPDQLRQWERESMFFNRILAMCRDEDTYPMMEVSCPFCPYHSVCSKPTEGAMMAQLEAHFVVRPWDNTKVGIID